MMTQNEVYAVSLLLAFILAPMFTRRKAPRPVRPDVYTITLTERAAAAFSIRLLQIGKEKKVQFNFPDNILIFKLNQNETDPQTKDKDGEENADSSGNEENTF